jgi:hypothetical protein
MPNPLRPKERLYMIMKILSSLSELLKLIMLEQTLLLI